MKFNPIFKISPQLTKDLMRIEACKAKAALLPMTPTVIASLRETAKLYTTHYSTMIEGNQLQVPEITQVLKHEGHFPGRERDEAEVKGYYQALAQVEKYAALGGPMNESMIQTLHALVMGSGKERVKATPYREGQNVIRDAASGSIVYMPPEAKDVPGLMSGLVTWINEHSNELPCPVLAGIAHYQFATIHPYYDGNGRTARLLTTLVMHMGGYDLKGLYSLEEYYAKNLMGYYEAIGVGESHNYYLGRPECDISSWIEYFIQGVTLAFEKVIKQMEDADGSGETDHWELLRTLDPKQRKALELFKEYEIVTSKQIGDLFGYKARTSTGLTKAWVETGFLKIVDPSKRGRKYTLGTKYRALIS